MTEFDVDEVSLFLGKLGLNEDAEKLRKEDISMDILREMTTDDLRKIGITFGHSLQIRKAVDKSMETDENKELEGGRGATKERTLTDPDDERVPGNASKEDNDETPSIPSVREQVSALNKEKSLPIKVSPNAEEEDDQSMNLRVILIGKTGTGKSATANTILGGNYFPTSFSGSSITERCSSEWASRFGRKIQVIDTPGLFDTFLTQEEIEEEIKKCIAMSSPGPHAFILVLSMSRFTKEEEDTAQRFFELFENAVFEYFIVLFTRLDDLEYEGKTLAEHLRFIPKNLDLILQKCQGRCIAFNNRDTDVKKDQQVQQLLAIIDKNCSGRETKFYTDEMFQEAERMLKNKEEEMKRVLKYEQQQKYEVLRKEIEEKYKKLETNLRSRQDKFDEISRTTEDNIASGQKEIEEIVRRNEEMRIEIEAEEIERKKNIELMELHSKRNEEKISDDSLRERIVQSIKKGEMEMSNLLKSATKPIKKFLSKFKSSA